MNWKSSASSLVWNIRPFIDGRYVDSAGTEMIENINPATATALCSFGIGDAQDVHAAVEAARRRQPSWSEMSPATRCSILRELADLIVAHKSELALLDSLEMGKPISAALHEAEFLAAAYLRSWAGFGDKLFGVSAPLGSSDLTFNTYEPRGVIAAITAWNFPMLNAIYKAGPILAAGNAVVLKPSELTPSSALKLAELALEAGVPAGVFNVVPGLGSTVGAALANNSDVDMISFTGSTVTGRAIMELAARSNGKPLILECGGKSPHIVFPDAKNLDVVAKEVASGFLWNQGQVCAAHTRLIAHDSIKDELRERIVAIAKLIRPNDPLDERSEFGPLASAAQYERVRHYINEGISAGAIPVLHGVTTEPVGYFVAPTVFDGVSPSMSIVREEIFGPVLSVQSFSAEEEAISSANGTSYGLAATIWTSDLGRARRVAHLIRAGAVIIRTSNAESPDSGYVVGWEPQKASGFGAELGLEGLRSYSTLKLVSFLGA